MAKKTTTSQQVSSVHAAQSESKFIVLTDETFKRLTPQDEKYHYKNSEGETFEILITEKVSGYGSGKKTVYLGTLNGEPFQHKSIEDLKRLTGCIYRNSAKSGGPQSEAQVEEYSQNWSKKLLQKVEEVEKILTSYLIEEQFNFEPLKEFVKTAVDAHCNALYNVYKEEQKAKREERREVKVSKKADSLKTLSVQELQLLIAKMQEEVSKRAAQ